MKEIRTEFDRAELSEPEPLLIRLGLDWKVILKHVSLFLLTFASAVISSQQFFFTISDSILFASLLLLFLAVHEFGHYIAAVIHRISTTLPYFIPMPLISPIGTMGAVIRIKERIQTTKKLFDVGIAGPLAGFVIAFTLLLIGFFTLPDPSYVLSFPGHEELKAYVQTYGTYPSQPIPTADGLVLMIGDTLLYSFLAQFFNNVPPMWEMYHFPFLFAGWLGLLFTALNLTPIGQLDGGHILYSLIGFKKHQTVARLFFGLLSVFGGIGIIPLITELLVEQDPSYAFLSWAIWGVILLMLLQRAFRNEIYWTIITGAVSLVITFVLVNLFNAADWNGYTSWAVWMVFILVFVKVEHPPVWYEQALDPKRKVLGWFSMSLFILCISPNPIYMLSF